MASSKITTSSTAEYFAKNLQQVGFSSSTKAVLTTLKEAVDNSLDACEDAGILPEIKILIEKKGEGTGKNTDLIRVKIEDNGPGLDLEDLPKVFGEYLASSKFGRGRCSRGQQGIGISAATTWAQLTSAKGASVITKTKKMRAAISAVVNVDIKQNKGILKNKESVNWDRPHGLSVEFLIDGRMQLNGEGGLLTYINGTALVNPHLDLEYKIGEDAKQKIKRVADLVPNIPEATMPHPHTMKLGEFLHHSHLFGKVELRKWLKKGFTRISDGVIDEIVKNGLSKGFLTRPVNQLSEGDMKQVYQAVQKTELMAPSTRSVMIIGEHALAMSIKRMGEIDFFSVVTRKPKICDSKPVAVEVAIARFLDRSGSSVPDEEVGPVTVLRFANRVPLQFDKSACAIVQAIETVNWRSYGLSQAKSSLPSGPYVIAVSVVSPFIKFKNASKETIDASDELVEEIRRTLMQAGQKLSRHINKENREADLEKKLQHIEQFCPILVECLCRITEAPAKRKKKATEGIMKLLGRDVNKAEEELQAAKEGVNKVVTKQKEKFQKAIAKNKKASGEDSEPEEDVRPNAEDVVTPEEVNEEIEPELEAAEEAESETEKPKKGGKTKKGKTAAPAKEASAKKKAAPKAEKKAKPSEKKAKKPKGKAKDDEEEVDELEV